jgi:NADH-quinone oxidoreductase subunit K
MSASVNLIVVASAALFAIGGVALMIKRSVVVMIIGTQQMLAAGSLAFVAFNNFGGLVGSNRGPAMALFVGGAALCELAVGLTMAAVIYREQQTFLADEYESVAG